MTTQIDFTRVTNARALMGRAYGAQFIPASVSLKPDARRAGEDLAQAVGLSPEQAAQLADIELISIYMAAKKPFAGQRRAEEILSARDMPNAPSGVPSPSQGIPELDLEALKDMVDKQAKSQLAAMNKQIADMAHTIEELNARTPRKLEITPIGDAPKITFDMAHYRLPDLIRLVQAAKNIMLVGAAGSGKSTACEQVAEALGLPFYMAASVTDPVELMGYLDINGRYIGTEFRKAYEEGGVFLLDEMDRSDPQALCSFNAAFANTYCPFPDGRIKKHKDFRLVAAVNTFGLGADRIYVGATQLDGAFLNRFGSLTFDYDPAVEDAITPNKAWLRYVRAVRAIVEAEGVRHIVSPRCSKEGAGTLALGFSWQFTADMWLWQGLDSETRARIELAVPMHEYEPNADII